MSYNPALIVPMATSKSKVPPDIGNTGTHTSPSVAVTLSVEISATIDSHFSMTTTAVTSTMHTPAGSKAVLGSSSNAGLGTTKTFTTSTASNMPIIVI